MISINMGLMKKIITQHNVNLTLYNSPTAALKTQTTMLLRPIISYFMQ